MEQRPVAQVAGLADEKVFASGPDAGSFVFGQDSPSPTTPTRFSSSRIASTWESGTRLGLVEGGSLATDDWSGPEDGPVDELSDECVTILPEDFLLLATFYHTGTVLELGDVLKIRN